MIKGTVFDFETAAKRERDAKSLERILDSTSLAEIQGLKKKALRDIQSLKTDLLNLLEHTEDPLLRKEISAIITKTVIHYTGINHLYEELGAAAFPLASHGDCFIKGPKGPRLDKLARLIIKAWETWIRTHGTKPTARNVYDLLNVDESEDDRIYWKPAKTKEEKSTSFKTIQSRITKLRKKGLLPFPID